MGAEQLKCLISKGLVLIIGYTYITGFKKTLTACCGRGGPYNYNKSAVCGNPGVSACVEPSQYVNWDGIHLTEAAYKLITQALLQAPMHTIPRSRF